MLAVCAPPSPPSLMGHCVLHGFYRFSQFLADICMGLMHFPRFVNALHGFYLFFLIIAGSYGFYEFFLNICCYLYGFS